MDLAVGGAWLGIGRVVPVDEGVVEGFQDARGDVDHRMPIARTGLEEHDAGPPFTETAGEDAASGTGADHGIIRPNIGHRCAHPLLPRATPPLMVGWLAENYRWPPAVTPMSGAEASWPLTPRGPAAP